ncbi:hypothetical protein F4780DRAFT_775780 [Xylariomycetidae sp. FL0641]|nr:hypothetical protein F4780DRAFT_775780 [Xylariomycetidae sp. FL0641]
MVGNNTDGVEAVGKPASEFEFFSQLPPELQLMVWDHFWDAYPEIFHVFLIEGDRQPAVLTHTAVTDARSGTPGVRPQRVHDDLIPQLLALSNYSTKKLTRLRIGPDSAKLVRCPYDEADSPPENCCTAWVNLQKDEMAFVHSRGDRQWLRWIARAFPGNQEEMNKIGFDATAVQLARKPGLFFSRVGQTAGFRRGVSWRMILTQGVVDGSEKKKRSYLLRHDHVMRCVRNWQ